MGMLAGVLSLTGQPVEREYRALRASLEATTPDGVSGCTEGALALVCGASHIWGDESSSPQPHRSPAGSIVSWDGRLDNRDDLLQCLGSAAQKTSDAAIALATFERWGSDGLARLIGDWSLVIWDPIRQTLHLARDYMGVRPLYLHAGPAAVRWSSSLGELARRTNRVDALSDRFAARFLALELSTGVTPYEGIREVPTACCVSIGSTGTETTARFWTLQPGLVRYRDPREYEEHLRALWREAVGARLRTTDVVWAELSGGLDSSSVTCMADTLIKNGDVSARAVQPISHVTLESTGGDERRFIADVEARIGASSRIIGVERTSRVRDADTEWITPLAAHGVQLACVNHVREHGGRVILSGRMGDTIMGGSPDNSVAVFDDLAERRVRDAIANMRLWSRACRVPFLEIAYGLVRQGLGAPTSMVNPPRNARQRAGLELLTPPLRLMADEPLDIPNVASRARLAKRSLVSAVLSYSLHARLGIPPELHGVTYTFPFAHRPLVEYMLAIPGEELSAPGQTRSLMRRAFDGLVPARVLHRTSKGNYPPALARLTRAAAAALPPTERLEVVRRGWIDPQRLDRAIRLLVDGSGRTSAEVQRVLRLEEWLLTRDRRAPSVTPQRKEVTTDGILIA